MLNRERALRRELAALMKSDHPPLTGRQLLDCKSSIWAMPEACDSTNGCSRAFRGKCVGKSTYGPHPNPLPKGE